MEFLYYLEGLRTPFLDAVMSAITYFGDEIVFITVALYIFWCSDKYRGYLVLSVGFVGTVINQFLKLACRVPRPWVIDGDFTIVESAREGATGYSFPSGHTQNAVGTFGSVGITTKHRWSRILCGFAVLVIPFSRIYLGVHTLADVGASFLIALLLIAVLTPLFVYFKNNPGWLMWFFGFMLLLGTAYLLYTELFPFPADVDAANLASGRKNAYSLVGSLVGICIAYPLERRYINFATDARPLAQALKLTAGIGATLAIKSGLKAVFAALFGADIPTLDAVRYAVVVVFVVFVWPMTFTFWRRVAAK